MKENKRRSRAFWIELIRRYEATPNVTQRQFADDNDVTLATFRSWLYSLRKPNKGKQKSLSTEEITFIEIPQPPPSPAPSIQVSLFFPNDLILEFSTLPEADYLARLLANWRPS